MGTSFAKLVSTDRYLIKIVDRTISFQDIEFQSRNLKGLYCIFDDSIIIEYFHPAFLKDLDAFIKNFPKDDEAVSKYLRTNEKILLNVRHFFKMLRYSEDQKTVVTPELNKLIRESTKENKCDKDLLYKDTLKTNFISLMEMELYLRARYGHQAKQGGKFESVRSSIDLFVDSLDKQFSHEYYW